MKSKIDYSRLVPIEGIAGENERDAQLLRQMGEEARRYLLSFHWCKAIQSGWFGWGVGGIAAVFLFEIVPETIDVDKILWVVVGDLPPAYLVADESPTPLAAVMTYVELMEEWIDTVREGQSTENCVPVNTPASWDNANALETRLRFLKREFLDKPESPPSLTIH